MASHRRIKAALGTAVLAGSLASPVLGQAAASTPRLSLPTLLGLPGLPGVPGVTGTPGAPGGVPSLPSLTGVLAQLGGLSSLPLGGTVPSGGLASLGPVLDMLASEPGVPPQAAAELKALAAGFSSGNPISAGGLLGALGALNNVASMLPAPLSTTLSGLVTQLGSLGSINGIPAALAALGNVSGLPAGTTVPSGSLAPVASLLMKIAGVNGVSGTPAASILSQVAGVLGSGSPLSSPALAALAGQLQTASGSLPSPLNSLVGGIAGKLVPGSAGTGTTGTGTGTTGTGTGMGTGTGTTGTGTGTGTSTGGGTTGTGTGTGTGKGRSGRGTSHRSNAAHATIVRVRRSGSTLIVTLRCTAARSRRCNTTVSAANGKRRVSSRRLTIRGGRIAMVKLGLGSLARPTSTKKATIVVTAATGSFKSSKSLSLKPPRRHR